MNLKEEKSRDLIALAINAAQLLTLLVALAVLGSRFGVASERLNRNQSDIQELRSIVADLATASVAGNTMDVTHTRTLDELRRRIERLEINNE